MTAATRLHPPCSTPRSKADNDSVIGPPAESSKDQPIQRTSSESGDVTTCTQVVPPSSAPSSNKTPPPVSPHALTAKTQWHLDPSTAAMMTWRLQVPADSPILHAPRLETCRCSKAEVGPLPEAFFYNISKAKTTTPSSQAISTPFVVNIDPALTPSPPYCQLVPFGDEGEKRQRWVEGVLAPSSAGCRGVENIDGERRRGPGTKCRR